MTTWMTTESHFWTKRQRQRHDINAQKATARAHKDGECGTATKGPKQEATFQGRKYTVVVLFVFVLFPSTFALFTLYKRTCPPSYVPPPISLLGDMWTQNHTPRNRYDEKRGDHRSRRRTCFLLFFVLSNSHTPNYFRRRIYSCKDAVVSELSWAVPIPQPLRWLFVEVMYLVFLMTLWIKASHPVQLTFICFLVSLFSSFFLVPVCSRGTCCFVSVSDLLPDPHKLKGIWHKREMTLGSCGTLF